MPENPGLLRFLTAGSVDDGKSTLIGRLLYEANGVFDDQLESARATSARRGGNLDLSLITDGLKAEREQAITIDVGYRYFATTKRSFIIADAPGHEQYTRNMATAASSADAAVLLVDVRHGIIEQTRRHSYLLWLFGIRSIVVVINKMDLAGYQEQKFEEIRTDYLRSTASLEGLELLFVPASALAGDNIVSPSKHMSWYDGPCLLALLENLPVDRDRRARPFRMSLQTVIRANQDFRGYAGRVESGTVRPGDQIVALPSGRRSRVKEIFLYDEALQHASHMQSVVVTLTDHIELGRGDVLADPDNMPIITHSFHARLIWMSAEPLNKERRYLIRHCARSVCARIMRVAEKLDISSLEGIAADSLEQNEIAVLDILCHHPLVCEPYSENRGFGSFILVDPLSNETVGAGMILGEAKQPSEQEQAHACNIQGRSEHEGIIVWLTGLSGSGKTTISNSVCNELSALGFEVETLDGDLVRKHLGRGLGFSRKDRDENVRRIGFVARLLACHRVVVLVSAISPYRSLRDEIRKSVANFIEVYVNAPLAICEMRDPKGLYKKARSSLIPNFTGIDDPYEPPFAAEVVCETDIESVKACTNKIVSAVSAFGRQPHAVI